MLPSQLGNRLPTGATLGTGVTGPAVGVGGGLGVTMPERFASGRKASSRIRTMSFCNFLKAAGAGLASTVQWILGLLTDAVRVLLDLRH